MSAATLIRDTKKRKRVSDMQEVFDKIIEKLEECKDIMISPKVSDCFEEECKYNDCTVCAFANAIEIVKQEAEKYNNGWIPCSERMPEDEQVVLTCKCKSISILRYSTKTNHWYELSGNWWWSANMVTAWQPLSEPYQPKGE